MGLLDMFDTAQGRLGLGLLAAAGPRADGAGFGQRLAEGVGSMDQWQAQKAQQKLRDMQAAQAQMQMDEITRKNAEAAKQREWRAGLPGVMAPKYGAGDEGPTLGMDQAAIENYMFAPDSPYADRMMEQKLFPKASEGFTLGDGQIRYDSSGRVVAQGPAKENKPATKIEEWEYAKKNNGYKGSLADWVSIGPSIMAGAAAPLRQAQVDNIQAENAYNLPAPRRAPVAKPGAPMRGQVVQGYRFKGGNPADQSNWEKK